MQNFTTITLGELLTSTNETIKRNALSILKTLQRDIVPKEKCGHKKKTEYECNGVHASVEDIIKCSFCSKDIDEM